MPRERHHRGWRLGAVAGLTIIKNKAEAGPMADQKTAFLFDVDNTLLDNDHVIADLMRHLEHDIGHQQQERYWALFEELRAQLGYADYRGGLQRYRREYPRDFNILAVSSFLLDYHFANRLFPNSLDVVEHCQ